MKKIIIIFSLLVLIGCNKENIEPENPISSISYLKYSVWVENNNNLVYTQEYNFDNNGNVIMETFTNANNPQYNHISEFKYNENGRLISELRNNEIFKSIEWNNNVAEVYNVNGQKISEFIFSNDKLIEYRTGFINNNIQYKKYNYDLEQNIISIENENEIFVEFLDYDTTKLNPLNLIQSIGVLRVYYKPFFKNIFYVEKAYPYEGDDYSFPLTFYDYNYTFDTENRVVEIEDDKTLIYVSKFEYQ